MKFMGFIIVCTNYGLMKGMSVFEKSYNQKCPGDVNSTKRFGNLPLRLQIQKEDIVQQYLENKQRGEQRFNRNPRNITFLTKKWINAVL